MQKLCSFLSATILLFGGLLMPHDAIAKNTKPPVTYEEQEDFVRSKIREYLGNNPVYLAIAGCESTGDPTDIEHWDKYGKLKKNKFSSARGSFQILTDLHTEEALELGLHIRRSIDDYMKFVKVLLKTHDLKPWKKSKHCWGKYA